MMTTIKIGQIWRDCDKRHQRTIKVIGFPNDVIVEVRNTETNKVTRIQRWRMKPGATGYELIKEPDNEQ